MMRKETPQDRVRTQNFVMELVMKRKIGNTMILLGALLIATALGLYIYTAKLEKRGNETAEKNVSVLMEQIADNELVSKLMEGCAYGNSND